ADLMPVADGTPVGFNASSGTVSLNVALTRNGEAVTYITPEKDSTSREITTSANTSGLTHSLTLSLTEDAPQIIVANVLDAKTKLPVEGALVSADDRPLGYSDRTGYFAVTRTEISDSPIAFSRPGYATQELSLSRSPTAQLVELRPIADGVLFGRKFALDPQFGGEEKGAIGPTGVRASDLNLLVADYLARFLRASGANVILTRESDETTSALRRVELAERFGAHWFISIGHGRRNGGHEPGTGMVEPDRIANRVGVMHYPVSEEGMRLAAEIAGELRSQGIAESVLTEPGTDFVLTHTSSPAVIVQGPSPSTSEMEAELRYPAAARREAYAIYCGILQNLGLGRERTGQISLGVTDEEGNAVAKAMLRLDGAFILETDSQGQFTFSRLSPGEHHIEVHADGLRIWSGMVPVEAGGATSVGISFSGAALISMPGIM
ncbi:MAG: N-acetylmuramoyl-L-alanine amidase, partial [Candidatus Hydrogenedentota bacterium]